MLLDLKFQLNPGIYTKDPQETVLGKKILKNAIILIDEIGFESFTFKKLAISIGSAEKSIYRYFENKHYLLIFLSSWYWEWVRYLIQINLINIEDPERKLITAIENIVKATAENTHNEYINENVLHRIIINEGTKAYRTFSVDSDNKDGFFTSYKLVVQLVSALITDINPNFPYPDSLSSNLFEMANDQIFFAKHLPRLTSLKKPQDIDGMLIEMMEFFAFKLLK